VEELSISALSPVIEALEPDSPQEQPLICDKETFIKIYQLEKRRHNEDYNSSYLTHIIITYKDNRGVDFSKLEQVMLHTLKNYIRRGDAVCQWDKQHFAVLLYDIDHSSNVEVVEQRIKYFFYTNCNEADKVKVNFLHTPVKW